MSKKKKKLQTKSSTVQETIFAAITIQKAFKKYIARKQLKKKRSNVQETIFAAITIQRAFKRYTIKKRKEEEEMSNAVVKIQKTFKGFSTASHFATLMSF